MGLKIYNTLTRKKETFSSIKKNEVGLYGCGPTTYWYQHIGNFRTALMTDFLKRTLLFNTYKVNHVVNFTDVDDKTIKASKNEKITLKDLTRKYEQIYIQDIESLNILKPTHFLRATENIDKMIFLIKQLLKKEFAYISSDGVYFSISKSKGYGKLAKLDKMSITKERVLSDEYDKSNPKDFALWKFWTEDDGDIFWEADFGRGRPGWHIECSAMSMKELGETIDIHTGGMDLTFPHHTNEIAQSEGATGKKFVNYWVHGGMLNLKEEKMSKSLKNIYTLEDVHKHGYNPITYRYFCLGTHYRKPLVFSWEAMDSAQNALKKLHNKVLELLDKPKEGKKNTETFMEDFQGAINDDLNMPQALAVMWEMLKDEEVNNEEKYETLLAFDRVFALQLDTIKKVEILEEIQILMEKREHARLKKDWKHADLIRNKLKSLGYIIEDTPSGAVVKKV